MHHIVYVDLSAKVEHWGTDSAVAVADGFATSYLVPAKVKRAIRQLLTQRHGNKSVVYRTLALLVYMAIRDNLGSIHLVVIDRDYTGPRAEGTIKSVLLTLLRYDIPDVKPGFIEFANVKGSRADQLARRVFERKTAPLRTIQWEDVERIIQRK